MLCLWLYIIFFSAVQLGSAATPTPLPPIIPTSIVSAFPPVLKSGTINYAIINQTINSGSVVHNLLVTDPENGTLTFSIVGVKYFKNDSESAISASNASWTLTTLPKQGAPTQCSLAESYPFPRNLFCMEPNSNAIRTTTKYNNVKKADFSLFVLTVVVIDNGSPQLNLTTNVYFRIKENCNDSTQEYTNLMTGCPEASEIIRRSGSPNEVGFLFTVPNNTRIARITVDFGLFSPFKVIEDFVDYSFEYVVGVIRKSALLRRRLLVNTTVDRKIAMFLWKPIEIIGDKANISVSLKVGNGKMLLSGSGQGIELFLVNGSRNYCSNSQCVGLYNTLSKAKATAGGKFECTRQDQYVVVEKYSSCIVAISNAPPVLQNGTLDYAIINQTINSGSVVHNMLVTDPDKGILTFSIVGVKYFKNDSESPISVSNASWTLTKLPKQGSPTQCSLAESYPFPRNLFCMEPNSNAIRTTSKYNNVKKADFSLFVLTVVVIDNGSPQLNLTTNVYFRIKENCNDSAREYTNLMTGCPEASEIIRRSGSPNEVGFLFTVPNNTRIARITVDFGLFTPFKLIEDFVDYSFEYVVGVIRKAASLRRRLLVNTTLDRKIAMFLWKPIEIIGDKANISVSLKVGSGKMLLSGGGQGIELFLVNGSRNYCSNSQCVGLYNTLSKAKATAGGKFECTRQDQYVVVEKYSSCIVAISNAPPVLQNGAIDYAIINQTINRGSVVHNLLVTDPEKGILTFSIVGVKYFKNDSESPISASNASWTLTKLPKQGAPTQCSLAESYPFPRNLFCMEPNSNAIRTTTKYNNVKKADFSLFVLTVVVIDNGSPQLNLTTNVYFRIKENCSDSTREYTNLMTGCPEASEIIRRSGSPSEIGFLFTVPNNTRIARITVDFGLFSPFKLIEDFVDYRFEYGVGLIRKSASLRRRLLVNTTVDRKIAMFLWKPIEIISDKADIRVSLKVGSGKILLSGSGQGIELFLVNGSRNYCSNSQCVGLYNTLSKAKATAGGKFECTRQDQYVVVEKYSSCIVHISNAPPVLQNGTLDYAIINQTINSGSVVHNLLVTDPDNGILTFSIVGVKYFKNDSESPISASNASWTLTKLPKQGAPTQCSLAESYPFPRNLFCMEPNSNAIRTTTKYNNVKKADFSLFVLTVIVIDNGSPQLNLTTNVYFRIKENCNDSTREYTNLMTGCPEASEIIRRSGSPNEVGFLFTVPNNTRIARITVDFGLFSPFKLIEDFVDYSFEYVVGVIRKAASLRRRLLVNTTLDRKIAMFLWKPIEIIGDKANISVSLKVGSGKMLLSGGGQGIELFLVNGSRNYCSNIQCVGLYNTLSKAKATAGGKFECTRQDQYVVVEKYSSCIVQFLNAPPVLQNGTLDYAIINQTINSGSVVHNLLVTDPDNGILTFSIVGVKYFKNDSESPISASNASWTLTKLPKQGAPTQCSLAESYPFPRNLFCMEPNSNAIRTTTKYNNVKKADFSLFVLTVVVIDNGSPQLNLTTNVYFRIKENCDDSTQEYTNLMTGCPEASEIIRRSGSPSEIGFLFTVPNNTRIARITVDFGLFSPFKLIEDFVDYSFEYVVGVIRKAASLRRRLLVNTTVDRKIAMFLWKPIEIIGDKANISVSLKVGSGKMLLSGGGQGIELFLVNGSRNYCSNIQCVGLYNTLSKAKATAGGKFECTRQDQYVVVEKYSSCIANVPPTISISNIELNEAPMNGQIIGIIIGADKEKTSLTYGILWMHSKLLDRNLTESTQFTGRKCTEVTKVAPLSYICVDPSTGKIKATSEFKYSFGEKLTVKVFVIDSGSPRQYSTRVFEITTKDLCKSAKTRYSTLTTTCMVGNKYVSAGVSGTILKFAKTDDRVVRIGIDRKIVQFPIGTSSTLFTLRQVVAYGTPRKYGKEKSVFYNNTAIEAQKVSYVQLALELSFHGAVEAELSAVSLVNNSKTVRITLQHSGIRLFVHSLKRTCGSTSCVKSYQSWVTEAKKLSATACLSDPMFVHQYFKICLDPPIFHLLPKNTTVLLNSAISVSCSYQNFTSATFKWVKDGEIFTPPKQSIRIEFEDGPPPGQQQEQTLMSINMQGNAPELQGYYHCMVIDALNHTVNSTKSLVRFRDVSTSRMVLKINQRFSDALRDKTSSDYNKLSAEVTKTFDNMFNRNGMHKQRKIVVRDFRPGSVIASIDVYYMNVTENNRKELCSQLKSLSPHTTDTSLQISSLKTVSYDCCYREQTGEANIKGVITWSPVIADSVDTQKCPYGLYNTQFNTTTFNKASRLCLPNFEVGAQWQTPNTSECAYKTKTTLKLQEISQTNISESNVEQIATELNSITSNETDITNRLDVKFTADTVESLVNSNKKLSKIANAIVNTTSNMMDFNSTYVAESQIQYKSSSKVLTSLDKLALQLDVSQNMTVKTVSKNVALTIKPIKKVIKDIIIKAKRSQGNGYSNIEIEESTTQFGQTSIADAAQILLSQSLLRKAALLKPASFNRIYSFVFESDRLFISKNRLEQSLNSSDGNKQSQPSDMINSRILSASIGSIKLENLTGNEEMQGRFKILSHNPGSTECVFWNFNTTDGFGAWSSNGCRPVGLENSMQKCRCNHLTNFAILLDVTGKGTPKEAALALSIITYIGCAISLLCLLLTVITFAAFRKLREKRPPRILICLCTALILTLIIFLAGTRAKDLKSCQAVAVLIHYFVLVSFMWMAVEGFNLYLNFVKVMNASIPRFILKSSIFAWGVPIVIVAISAAVTKLEAYGKKKGDEEWLCMVTGTAFYVAYILPILLIVVGNLIVMGFVIKSLKKSSQVSKDKKMTGLTMARIGAACSVLMGTTWIIGLFAIDVLTVPMQILFCIFNSLQGFFIFVFYCARNKDAKRQWIEIFGSKSADDSKSSSMGLQKNRVSKDSNKLLILSTNSYEMEKKNNRSSALTTSIQDTVAGNDDVSLKTFGRKETTKGQQIQEEKSTITFYHDHDTVGYSYRPGEMKVSMEFGEHDGTSRLEGHSFQ